MRNSILAKDDGASAVEYAILIGGIAAVVVAIIFVVGAQSGSTFSTYRDCYVAGAAADC